MIAYVIIGVIALAGAVVAGIMMSKQKPNKMKPLGLSDFSITGHNEGVAIPLLWGTKKIVGNIVWYGNLTSKEEHEDVGGKGLGASSPMTGYRYFMDIWLGLPWSPHGGITLLDVYSQEKQIGTSGLGTYYINPGNTTYYPTEAGTYANKLSGQSHIFLSQYDLGVNSSYMPNIEFVLKNTSSCPLTYSNMTEGVNPAAIIWDILTMTGCSSGNIDTTSFQEAATYWYNKGYGLNVVIQSQISADEMISQLLTYCDFTFYKNDDGKYVLKALKDTDTSVATINTEDVRDFRFIRKAWDDTSNDFRATYIDEDQDYTQRNINIDNVASIDLTGERKEKSIDLTAFNQVDTASKRLAELMKVLSYPSAQIQCSVPYRFVILHIGDVVTINNTDYGITNGHYRVMSIEEANDSNYIALVLTEMTENLFDDNYIAAGGTQWVAPDNTPRSLSYEKMFELPYSESIGTTCTFLCLAQRKGIENGFAVYSTTIAGADAHFLTNLTTFSTRGVLNDNYYDDTGLTLDDEVGILFTPHRWDPTWDSISRTNLFTTRRVIICGNEMMTFQNIVPEGLSGAYRIIGICRGLLGTPVEDHASGSEIWIAEIDNNIITSTASTSYYKFVPYVDSTAASIATCSVVTGTNTLKSIQPLAASRVKAVRSGSNVSVTVIPAVYNTNMAQNSAGTRSATLQTDKTTADYLGYLQYKVSAGSWVDVTLGTHTFNYSQAGGHLLTVRYNNEAVLGQEISMTVGASDTNYYA